MRIRKPFAAAFVGICLIAALAGFSPQDFKVPSYGQSDKGLHFVAFFALTLAFYWILETSRRKVLQMTFTVCTVGLGFASEIVQGLLPIQRQFDYYDILANVLGSLAALGLCNWYHIRMMERKRAARGYGALAGEDQDDQDVELGEGRQESGIVRSGTETVQEELDNWDENAEDWEDTDVAQNIADTNGMHGGGDLGEGKKRAD